MSNKKNTFNDVITNKRTIPYNTTLQGTINTVGTNVQGSDALTYNTLVGTIAVGNTVTGSTSGATGVVYADSGTVLKLSTIVGVFTNLEVLTFRNTAGTSVATAAVNGVPTYTLFSQQCKVGDFIYNATQSEVHKITYISSDFSMQIQEKFGTDLVTQSLIISPSVPHPREISILIPSGSPAGLIDGVALPAGVGWSSSTHGSSMYNTGNGSFVDPVIVDMTGTTANIQINY